MITPIVGDARHVLPGLPDACIDAIITDPPYELGFMGKRWDATGVAYDVAMWTECLRVLRPGGYLASFGGTRTYHRMACAVEDAGFHIQDSLIWLHAQGFPKGKSQLKPAQEPIVLARKRGVGGLNIDATRVDGVPRTTHARGNVTGNHAGSTSLVLGVQQGYESSAPAGRWPSNALLSHGEECADVCAQGCPVAELDAQSGMLEKSHPSKRGERHGAVYGGGKGPTGPNGERGYTDTGGASRFFPTFRYQAKAPPSERPKVDGVSHPTVKPLALMRWLVRLLCPPDGTVLDPFVGSGTTIEACMMEGMRVIGIEGDPQYVPHILHRIDRAWTRRPAA